jgi:hypothetical protein
MANLVQSEFGCSLAIHEECRQRRAAAALTTTLEIYDAATGRTTVVLGAD